MVFETQQDCGRFYLGALAMLGLDLQRGIVVLDDGSSLQATGLFVEYVHANVSLALDVQRKRWRIIRERQSKYRFELAP